MDFFDLPSEQEVDAATNARRQLAAILGKGDHAQLRLVDGEKEITLPFVAIQILAKILDQMAEGHAVSLVPVHAELTTQEAADFLNVSRPYFVKLLEKNEIAYHKAGVRRRVTFKDLVAYKERIHIKANNALDELAKQAQELDMGY